MKCRELISIILAATALYWVFADKTNSPTCLINTGTSERPVQRWVDCRQVPEGWQVIELKNK